MSKKYFDIENIRDSINAVANIISAFGYRFDVEFQDNGTAQSMFLIENRLYEIRDELNEMIDKGYGLLRREKEGE